MRGKKKVDANKAVEFGVKAKLIDRLLLALLIEYQGEAGKTKAQSYLKKAYDSIGSFRSTAEWDLPIEDARRVTNDDPTSVYFGTSYISTKIEVYDEQHKRTFVFEIKKT